MNTLRNLARSLLLALLIAAPAHAAYVDSTVRINTSSTPDVGVPVGVHADTIVVMACAYDSLTQLFEATDGPTGFTRFADGDITNDGHSFGVYWKRATGDDAGSYTFTGSVGSSAQFICEAIAFSGRDTTNPPVYDATISNAANTSPVSAAAPSVTALGCDDLLVILIPDVDTTGSYANDVEPTGYSPDRENTESGFMTMAMAVKENASAGATGTVTWTYDLTGGPPTPDSGYAIPHIRIPAASCVGGSTVTNPLSGRGGGAAMPVVPN